jgi:hypothetical protein
MTELSLYKIAHPNRPMTIQQRRFVRSAVGIGPPKATEALPAKVMLTVGGIDLDVEIEGAVELE